MYVPTGGCHLRSGARAGTRASMVYSELVDMRMSHLATSQFVRALSGVLAPLHDEHPQRDKGTPARRPSQQEGKGSLLAKPINQVPKSDVCVSALSRGGTESVVGGSKTLGGPHGPAPGSRPPFKFRWAPLPLTSQASVVRRTCFNEWLHRSPANTRPPSPSPSSTDPSSPARHRSWPVSLGTPLYHPAFSLAVPMPDS